MFKRILVPLDGSRLSERAIGPAFRIAEQDGSELILMQAPVYNVALAPAAATYGAVDIDFLNETTARAERSAREYLGRIAEARTNAAVATRLLVVEGDPAGAILDSARAESADLIVMSTHGLSGLARWMLGSVTERVLGHAPCPVLVIRHDRPIGQSLITLDGSPLAERAVRPGVEVARALGTPATLLRVLREVPTGDLARLDEAERGLGRRLVDERLAAAEAYVKEQAAAQGTSGGRPIAAAVRQGPVAEAILGFADAEGVDLIAMATHGRTGLTRWVYDSITEKLLRSASANMLIVRPGSEAH